MKFLSRFLIIFIFFTSSYLSVYPYTADEIVDACKQASAQLKSVEFEGKTTTGSVNVTSEEGVLDYANKFFYSKDLDSDKVISETYCFSGITYIYDAAMDSWLKFTKDLDIGSDIFDKNKIFCSFPKNTSGTGFVITFAGNDMIDNEDFYCVQSSIFNSELAKLYIKKSLDKFVPSQIASWLRQDQRLLDNYLDIYTQNPISKLWISKDNFLLKKIQTNYQQMTGPNESISISREITYRNFDKPLKGKIPQAALDADEVTPEDMGF